MNKGIIYAAGSFVIGAVSGALVLDKIWSDRFDREANNLAADIRLEYARYYAGEDGKPTIASLGITPMSKEDFQGEAEKVIRSIRDARTEAEKPPVDYSSFYQGGSEDQPIMNLDTTAAESLIKQTTAQSEAIQDAMGDDPEEATDEPSEELHNAFEDNVILPPDFDNRKAGGVYLLTTKEFMEEERPKGYETLTVTWFEYDNTLIDDSDGGNESIISIEDTITDKLLQHFGWESKSNEDTIFVRNEKSEIDFEVTRDERSYAEVIAGITEEDEPRRKKRPEDD